jgi:hypothetical protein
VVGLLGVGVVHFVVQIEAGKGEDLEEGLTIEIDSVELVVFLVVDVVVGEAELGRWLTLWR